MLSEYTKNEILSFSDENVGECNGCFTEVSDEAGINYILIKWIDGYYEVEWEETGEKEIMSICEMKQFLDELDKENTYWS